MSEKKEGKKKRQFSAEYLDEVAAAFKQLNPPIEDKQKVLQVGKQLTKTYQVAAVQDVIKRVAKHSFSFKQLSSKREEGQPPPSVEAQLDKKVTTKIAEEAAKKLETVLATGKSLEDALGPYAKQYGFEDTADFIVAMFDFWDVWHGKVPDLVKERDEYKWAITQLLNSMTPEVAEDRIRAALQEFAMNTMIAGQISGKCPTPKEMMEHLQNLKEILRS